MTIISYRYCAADTIQKYICETKEHMNTFRGPKKPHKPRTQAFCNGFHYKNIPAKHLLAHVGQLRSCKLARGVGQDGVFEVSVISITPCARGWAAPVPTLSFISCFMPMPASPQTAHHAAALQRCSSHNGQNRYC